VSEASAGRRPSMPRKALAPARAALRFAHQATGECEAARPGRRGRRTLAGACPEERTGTQRLPTQALRQATNPYEIICNGDGQIETAWLFLRPVRKPVHCGSPQAACPSGFRSSHFAWSRYAPFAHAAGRTRCGLEGVSFIERAWTGLGRHGSARGAAVNTAVREGRPRRLSTQAAATAEQQPESADGARSLLAKGRQGEVHFFLQRVSGGLYVEREEIPRRGLRTLQSVQFTSASEFNRWCDSDPVRFEHPLLHAGLKRDGDVLWRSEPKSDHQ